MPSLMNWKQRFQLLFFLTLVIAACDSSQGTTEETKTEPAIPVSELTLKEPSELAKLMRVMEAHADSSKLALNAGGDLPEFPDEIENLFTAIPTENMHIDTATFPAFATHYIAQVKALHEADPEQRAARYDLLVQSCANCHYAHCPGPLVKIEKMYLGEDKQ